MSLPSYATAVQASATNAQTLMQIAEDIEFWRQKAHQMKNDNNCDLG